MVASALLALLVGSSGCYLSHDRNADGGLRSPDAPTGLRDTGPLRDALTLDTPAIDAPSTTPSCTWPPRPPASDRSGLFAWQQAVLVGNWTGVRTDPWDAAPVEVLFRFGADGRYDAHCLAGECGALYWGDADIVGAPYHLRDVTESGGGTGALSPLFMGEVAWEGRFEDLVITEDGRSLSMRFYGLSGLGPVVYALTHLCD